MDTLASFLDGPRARGAFLLRSLLEPPFSLRIEDGSPLTIVAMVRGDAWIAHDDGIRHALHPGDVAIVSGREPYTVADDPATEPQVIIHPGQRCTTPDGRSLHEAMDLGVRTWGNSATGSTVMLTGTYQSDGEVSRRLLDSLPRTLVLAELDWDCPLVGLLADEIVKDDPGQEAVLDRILDLLLIAALRAWFATSDPTEPSWFHAHADPVVGPALRLLHNDPTEPWTVATIAASVGVSRAALARRFHQLVGEPPMTYLAGWRLALAADLLREPDTNVSGVARRVGYSSPFTFSTAFKRHYGISPTQHRQGFDLGRAG